MVGATSTPSSATPSTTEPIQSTTSSQSTRLSTSSTSSPSSPPASVCISGTFTTNPNQQGLCQFSCSYGYCPPGPCICTSYGAQVPLPPATGVAGYPLAGEDASYIGLCSFTYAYGYFPTTACTSHANGTPQ
ncbi:hypothetical protein GE09DRAFT_1067084 [Coniochaeta sp. 2T2.1]|nr:hypothetical protein GE09DRAFT_1067084 [Coniochaeta sp. 2T2.1]